MNHDAVRDYYDSFGEREWMRLESPDDGSVEFAITCRVLTKYLLPGSRVLDIGGGPGRYSIWLAEHGHRVVLADLSSRLLSIAHSKIQQSEARASVEEIIEADACDLSHWRDISFDAVLSLGPFYHLPDPGDRDQAIAELRRVLRPGGRAFVALMPRYAFLRRTLAIPDERRHMAQPEFVSRVLERGVFNNDVPGRFTDGYGVRPEEVRSFFEGHGFATLALLAAEGIVRDNQRSLHELERNDPVTFQTVVDLILQTAHDPSIFGMAAHLLYVGTKLEPSN
jgi:ubiquinone/menaquinone biosynthesis C-methylase UbiE